VKLHYTDNMFCIEANLTENELAKRAGFAFDRHTRMWYTPFSTVAKKVARYAQPGVLDMIKKHEVEEVKNQLASRSTESSLMVPRPPGLEFLPFQIAGIEYMLYREHTLLADQMGLGKTIQVIGLCNLLYIKKVLIICPATLKLNWLREWKKWTIWKSISVGIAYSSYYPKSNIVIINYDILARNHDKIHSQVWDLVVMDEAHYLKNQNANRTKEVLGYRTKPPIQAKRKLALTGTPIVNRPVELFNVIKYLAPYAFYDKIKHARRYCNAFRGPWGWDMSGSSNLGEFQEKLRSTIMLRRIKKDVLKDLPDKIHQVIEIQPDQRVARLLDKESSIMGLDSAKKEYQKQMMDWGTKNATRTSFEDTSEIRRKVAEKKIPYVIKHLEDAIGSSGKVVCFCHHRCVVDALKKAFADECVTLVGGTPMEQRQKAVDRFQTEKGVKLFIGNIQAAGTGITLTAASHVVFAEISWVPGEIEQCEDRCHRIGTKESVLIQFLVMATSIDAAIAMAYTHKQGIIEKAIDERVPDDVELAFLLS